MRRTPFSLICVVVFVECATAENRTIQFAGMTWNVREGFDENENGTDGFVNSVTPANGPVRNANPKLLPSNEKSPDWKLDGWIASPGSTVLPVTIDFASADRVAAAKKKTNTRPIRRNLYIIEYPFDSRRKW